MHTACIAEAWGYCDKAVLFHVTAPAKRGAFGIINMVHGSIVLLLCDSQAPRERNDHVAEILGTYRKAAAARERTCGHEAPLYACRVQ
eukprot:5723795-Heterocapsa_arctica.AAC.1